MSNEYLKSTLNMHPILWTLESLWNDDSKCTRHYSAREKQLCYIVLTHYYHILFDLWNNLHLPIVWCIDQHVCFFICCSSHLCLIQKILKKFHIIKTFGKDHISALVLMNCVSKFASFLTDHYQIFFLSGTLPNDLKLFKFNSFSAQ